MTRASFVDDFMYYQDSIARLNCNCSDAVMGLYWKQAKTIALSEHYLIIVERDEEAFCR